MKLLRLHIQGFKSFKDRTTINFDEGITGIVGPNGCGKSNIVDALFWVMGEQSAKHLRGKSMQDLIFAGSSKYSPAAWAEVTLVLENDEGKHIHIMNQVSKPQEIALTRKLYRNGETEYRINNIPCRLKDIQEVFMDTGAGAKSYSIIAQGEINRLVQAKPEERRTMIEEVAGITKFKIRKRDSLKKIEHTTSNLNRLQDLQAEIYKNLKALEKQAEKAERARTLRAKVEKHELIVESHREFDFLSDFKQGKTLLQDKYEALERDTIERDQLEVALEDERNRKVELTEVVDQAQADYNKLAKELAQAEEKLNYLKRSAVEKEKYIENKKNENMEIDQDLQDRTERLVELADQLKAIEEANFGDIDFSELEEKVDILKEQLTNKEEELSQARTDLQLSKDEFSQIDQLLFKNTSKLEEYAANLHDINEEIESLEKHTSGFSNELKSQRDLLKSSEVKSGELKAELETLKVTVREQESEQRELDQKVRTLSKDVIQVDSKRQALIEINKNQGASVGAQTFMQETESDLYQVFGNLIQAESHYAKAIEALFHDVFNSIVTIENKSQTLVNWYAQNPAKAWDLLNVSSEQASFAETAQRLSLRLGSEVIAVENVIQINGSEFSQTLKKFFEGYFIVDGLDLATAQATANDINFKGLITKDSSIIIRKDASKTQISVRDPQEEGMGVVQRNNLINELAVELEIKTQELKQAEDRSIVLSDELKANKERLDLVQEQFNTVHSQYVSVKSALESKESSYQASFSRMEILSKRKVEISQARLELIEKDEELQSKKDNFSDIVENATANIEELAQTYQEIKSQYESARDELLKLQANAKSFESQMTNIKSQMQDVERQIERYQEKKENNLEQLEKLAAEIEEMMTQATDLEQANYDKVEALEDREAQLSEIKDQLAEIMLGMQDRENRVRELNQIINKNDKSVAEIEVKMKQIVTEEEMLVRNMFDRYQIDLRDILGKVTECSPAILSQLEDVSSIFLMETEDGPKEIEKKEYSFEKRFPAQVKESVMKLKNYRTDLNRLGDINWQAIEEYDRQKLRHDFLKFQEQELKSSLDDLQRAINHIDEKCRVRFKAAFEEVNTRFSKVFPIIFGGGNARLDIVGDLDSAECGIDIIAQPPGKKMQNINLMSGGEKAMTAVSLIFSIFLVKPSPFCLLDEVDAPLDDANVGRFNELLREMSAESQFILITHNKKTMELNDTLYGVTMQEAGVSKALSVQLH
jgi:chromosome segregation protein